MVQHTLTSHYRYKIPIRYFLIDNITPSSTIFCSNVEIIAFFFCLKQYWENKKNSHLGFLSLTVPFGKNFLALAEKKNFSR